MEWTTAKELKVMNFRDLQSQPNRSSYQFHTVYVVKEPLKETNLFFHWALIFEGHANLLRVEYFNNSKVHWLLVSFGPTSPFALFVYIIASKRAIWYRSPDFTYRWLLLLTLEAVRKNDPLHASQIGEWLEEWQKCHTTYNSISNNCQHFVRDIVAHFNTREADYLGGMMDVQNSTLLAPGLFLPYRVDQLARIHRENKRAESSNKSTAKFVFFLKNKKLETANITKKKNDTNKQKFLFHCPGKGQSKDTKITLRLYNEFEFTTPKKFIVTRFFHSAESFFVLW
ncbi:hypothetical protein RFI_20395 [Reticulomyxa filosa]|uniref:PPPDE domain-containing protein n=1 Tax=Reticulomyxa filosa TaxID=46433 RepID=X6MTH5_RETFI|nr:hypothetical protein RFI_20395 [Reticulomyxa filosa]|eukprot:ETO16941.1 hypothetical protein RFI_20395 [Reticulomyxa filosa]